MIVLVSVIAFSLYASAELVLKNLAMIVPRLIY
jgi:hypothetical protein